jgi:YHS domain-containing protein
MAMRTDIVSGKTFDDEKSGFKFMHEGTWYYFADISNRNRFIGNPQKYLAPAEPKS